MSSGTHGAGLLVCPSPHPPLGGLTSDLEEGHLEVPAESLYEDSLGDTDPRYPLLWSLGQ